MAIKRWKPTSEIARDLFSMQERMNRLMSGMFDTDEEDARMMAWSPMVDLAEKDDEYVIEAELPGLNKDDVKISVQNDVITIHGEKKSEKETKGKNYHRTERSFGSFSRSFSLPGEIDAGQVNAEFKNGLLSVTIPKSKEKRAKQIEVKVK